jgi:membrane protease YdiL (CAAX protease family)
MGDRAYGELADRAIEQYGRYCFQPASKPVCGHTTDPDCGMVKVSSRVQSTFTAIGLTFGSFAVGNIVVLAAVLALTAIGVSVSTRPSLRILLSTVLLQGASFGGLGLLYLKVRDLGFNFVPFTIPDLRDIGVTVIGLLALLGLLLASSSLISYFGLETAQNQIAEVGRQNPAVLLLLIPLSFVVVGPGEELLFRGLVQGTLRESFHPVRAIVLASALFASLHLFSLSGEGRLVYVGLVFVLALVLGGTYEYTGNLTVPAVIHGAYNAVQFASLYLATTGGL